MAIGAVVARILTQYSDKGSKAAQRDIAKLGKQFDDFAARTTRAFGIAAAAVGAFAIKVGKDAVQAAIADQKSQALLANSLRNTVGATDAAIASVEDYISKLQLQVGVADDDLRPALSKLAAVTGDVASAQQLLGLALDISAFSGSDLGSATQAVTRALQGNFRSLQKLVPSLDTATLKGKDFATILAEVQKATAGAAAARAGTLEYKLNILRIRFGEILETLGYALLPVIETFADTIQKKVLPQIEKWIKNNKEGLVKGLEAATKFMVKLVMAAVSFSEWISNNLGLVKALAVVIASLWATAKIVSFVLALKSVAIAFGLITVAANGATAATLRLKASLGFLLKIGKILGPLLLLLNLSGDSAIGAGGYPPGTVGALTAEGNARRASEKSASAKLRGRNPRKVLAPTITDSVTDSDSWAKLLANLNKLNQLEGKNNKISKEALTARQKKYNLLLKEMGIKTTEQQDAITQFAIRSNLLKQAAISGSPLTSIGSPTPMNMATAGFGGDVNVYVQGSVISERDLVDLVTKAQQRNSTNGTSIGGKYLGGGGGGGTRYQTQVI